MKARHAVVRHYAINLLAYVLVLKCGHERVIRSPKHKVPKTTVCVKCSEGKTGERND